MIDGDAFLKACLIRIMKAHKNMTHNELVSETTRQLASRFSPDPMSIKKRIEALIEVSGALLNFACQRNAGMVFPEGVS